MDESGRFVDGLGELLRVSAATFGEGITEPVLEVVRLDELSKDKETRERHQRWAAPLLGSAAVKETVRSSEKTVPRERTLAEAIRGVRRGDESLLPLINANVDTLTGENLEKVQFVKDVELEETPEGEIIQFGQTLSQIYKNTIQYIDWQQPVMDKRTVIEALSGFRIEDRNAEGLTDSHWLIDISLIPDLPDEELERLNFFPRTKTGIIRGITKLNGKLIMRSALFAGVLDPEVEGGERFDIPAVRNLLVSDWGITEAADWNENQILGCLVAIPKKVLPNGPVDVMPLLDNKIEHLAGEEVYWGMRGSKGDYVSVIQESKARDDKRKKLHQKVIKELVEMPDPFLDPADATDALQKLVEKHGTIEIIEDASYATWVFGEKARPDIEKARRDTERLQVLMAAGQTAQAELLRQQIQAVTARAQKNAKGGGCPSSRSRAEDILDSIDDLLRSIGLDSSEEDKAHDTEEDEYGSLTFECPKGHKNKRPRGKLIDRCQAKHCTASVKC